MIILIISLFLAGCGAEEREGVQKQTGVIGADAAISRKMAAKTIGLAFYSVEEMDLQKVDFSDLDETDWAYPYIAACVVQGFFKGSEEGFFRPEDNMTLWEARVLMERIAPDYDSRIVLTEENKNAPISYELWMQLLETALKARRGEESLYSYGFRERNAVLLSEEGLFDTGKYMAAGLNLEPYLYGRITFWEKEGEIVALRTVEALSPCVQNMYCRKEGGKLLLETGEGCAAIRYNRKVDDGIYDVQFKNGEVAELVSATSLGCCEVKRVDDKEIRLVGKEPLKWAENARIYDASDSIELLEFSDLICGTDEAEFYEKDGIICGAVVKEAAVPQNIRVFLKGVEQEKVTLSSETGFVLSNDKKKKQFKAGKKVVLTADLAWFDHGILTAEGDSPIQIDFSDGTSYRYEGKLEMERRGENSFSIINELPMERYLLGVVPHEMPTSFGQTALEAQAIAARSFAYNQFYGNAYCGYGAHVVDTTASQVYLGYIENQVAEAAVKATEGMCAVTEDGAVAQTYFYSTSSGFSASSEEVWSANGNFNSKGKSYLQARAHGNYETPKTEEEWLSFWQDWKMEGEDSSWYRWKVYFGCGQLTEILQKNMSSSAKCVVEGNISDLGKLKGVSIKRRGEGGVVMELLLTYEKGEVTLKTENTIRKMLSPTKLTMGEPIYLQRKNGESLTGQTMLPSGFFAVKEMKNEKGELTGIALYGGGNGHGVGMSHWGANGMAQAGYDYRQILQPYYSGVDVR